MSALMLAAWVGTQLKATLAQASCFNLRARSRSRSSWPKAAPCPLQALELSGNDAIIAIVREPSSAFVHVTLKHPQRASETVHPADCTGDAGLISEQLSRLGGSTRYFEIAPLLQQPA